MKIIECSRDAMQGIPNFIPTKTKIEYINEILKVGFNTIDVGSFVSKKIIPQLSDTKQVLKNINLSSSKSKLLVIIGNERGAKEAANFDEISYIGFPFSVSETFQTKNINSNIKNSLLLIEKIQNICIQKNKKLVIYFSMAFGNPYGDEWSIYIVAHWAEKLLQDFGINILSLSDTIGSSNPINISWLFSKLIQEFPDVEFGAHLHSNSISVKEKIMAAYQAGCRRFDGALMGIGGCPLAKDELLGNIPTEKIIDVLTQAGENFNFNETALNNSLKLAQKIFI